MRTVSINQPTYLPWLGYFHLMKKADAYVFLDNVQFEKSSWQCRNRIKSMNNWIWLTIPTHSNLDSLIKDVKIANIFENDRPEPWQRKHWKTLKTFYAKAPYFDDYSQFFKSIYKKRWTSLADFNIHIIEYLATQLGLSPVFLRSSELGVDGKRTNLLINICKKINADRYISSTGAGEYLKIDGGEELFKAENIALELLEYNHPIYPQLFGEFISNLSFVDCLFNCGPESSKYVFDKKPVE